MDTSNYEVVIIGGGPAGYTAAAEAAMAGKHALLIEESKIGGCCLNSGCIPMKTLLSATKKYDELKKLKQDVVQAENIAFSWDVFRKKNRENIQSMQEGIRLVLASKNVTILSAHAKLIDRNTVEVDHHYIKGERLVIATGARPSIPRLFQGIECVVTTDDIWEIKKLPSSIMILGAGAVGCEMASAFSSLGVEVTLVEMEKTLLPDFEKKHVRQLVRHFETDGVKVCTGVKVESVMSNETGVKVCLSNGEEKVFPKILIATGRRPNLPAEDAEKIGLNVDCRGFIKADFVGRTNLENVYCIGDANGQHMFAHCAMQQAVWAIQSMTEKKLSVSEEFIFPKCVYTNPPLAKLGMSKKEAEEKGYSVREGNVPYQVLGMARAQCQSAGRITVVRDVEEDCLLGVQIIGKDAYELIHVLQPYIEQKSSCKNIKNQIFAHPSLGEGVKIAVEETYDGGSSQMLNKGRK